MSIITRFTPVCEIVCVWSPYFCALVGAVHLCAASTSGLRSNIFSSACMLTRVSLTAVASVPSLRKHCIGPCSSLFTIPRERSSSAFRCFFVKLSSPPIFFNAFSNSALRMSSAFPRSRLMVGTVSSESLQDSKACCSCFKRPRASSAAFARAPLFNSTTSLRSSTLYKRACGPKSFTSAATFLGTAMSNSRLTPPTPSVASSIFAKSALQMSGSSEEAAKKMQSAAST
mmetsp:Transcript_19497/g.23356  ORF Transcript_19497/g.23356 Transcript_19497/m.23356 type:complete len:229 (-) Transcript_19497:1081-1767(-)